MISGCTLSGSNHSISLSSLTLSGTTTNQHTGSAGNYRFGGSSGHPYPGYPHSLWIWYNLIATIINIHQYPTMSHESVPMFVDTSLSLGQLVGWWNQSDGDVKSSFDGEIPDEYLWIPVSPRFFGWVPQFSYPSWVKSCEITMFES